MRNNDEQDEKVWRCAHSCSPRWRPGARREPHATPCRAATTATERSSESSSTEKGPRLSGETR